MVFIRIVVHNGTTPSRDEEAIYGAYYSKVIARKCLEQAGWETMGDINRWFLYTEKRKLQMSARIFEFAEMVRDPAALPQKELLQ